MATRFFKSRLSFARLILGAIVACALIVGVHSGVSLATNLLQPNGLPPVWVCSVGDQLCPSSVRTIAPMPTSRNRLTATTGADGKIYAIGGLTTVNPSGPGLSTVEGYDLSSNSWTCSVGDTNAGCTTSALAPMPTARGRADSARASDGSNVARIYVIGGDAGPNATNVVEAYDPLANTWICSVGDTSTGCTASTLAPMPTARHRLSAVTGPNGWIYALGGDSQQNSIFSIVEAYDPVANTWTCSTDDTNPGACVGGTTLAPMSAARSWFGAALGPDHRIYAIGGWVGGNSLLSSVEAYDVIANTWSSVSPLPQPQGLLGAAVGWDNRIYAIGGWSIQPGGVVAATAVVQGYSVDSGSWGSAPSMPTARSRMGVAVGGDHRIYVIGGIINNSILNQVEAFYALKGVYLPRISR